MIQKIRQPVESARFLVSGLDDMREIQRTYQDGSLFLYDGIYWKITEVRVTFGQMGDEAVEGSFEAVQMGAAESEPGGIYMLDYRLLNEPLRYWFLTFLAAVWVHICFLVFIDYWFAHLPGWLVVFVLTWQFHKQDMENGNA